MSASTNLQLIDATPANITEIIAIARLAWPPTYVPIIGEAQVAFMLQLFYSPDVLAQQMADGHQFIMAYMNDEAVGFAGYSKVDEGQFKLHKLYLLPSVQGKGVGKALVNFIVEKLQAVKPCQLLLNVNRFNTTAIAFYEKQGFTVQKTEDIDIGNGYWMNDFVYAKAI